MPFDPELLTEFIDTFYGYGTYSAPFWFVGMEEGGGHTLEENLRKVTNWHNHGCKELGSFMSRLAIRGRYALVLQSPTCTIYLG